MSLDSPLHLAAHPQPLDSVTVYSSPMVIPVTGPVVLDGAVAVAGSRVVHVGTRRWVFNELKHDMATNGRRTPLERHHHPRPDQRAYPPAVHRHGGSGPWHL